VQGVTSTKITKIDDESIALSLNPKHEKNQDKNTKVKANNMKCARLKYE
jgi:hypothetical protein